MYTYINRQVLDSYYIYIYILWQNRYIGNKLEEKREAQGNSGSSNS